MHKVNTDATQVSMQPFQIAKNGHNTRAAGGAAAPLISKFNVKLTLSSISFSLTHEAQLKSDVQAEAERFFSNPAPSRF